MFELSELPHPKRGAEAGYYPDPLGSGRARWWDGNAWTSTVGPKVEADAPLDKPLPAPTKVCPRCAVQTQTFAPRCPNCGRIYSRPSAWQIVGIAAAILVLGIGGCGACVAIGINAAEDELDDTAISQRQFDSVERGATRDEIEARFGDPYLTDSDDGLECLTYPERGEGLFELAYFDFCFREGRLVSKYRD